LAEEQWRQLFRQAVEARGGTPWRSLLELLQTDAVDRVPEEFPPAALDPDGFSRRDFLQLIAASAALGGLSGCSRTPSQKIIPYTKQPEGVTPSQKAYYATSLCLDGYATGVLVESHEGRPTKIEGNPEHPFSLGAASVFEQASVLGLYDPNRARSIRVRGRLGTFEQLIAQLSPSSSPSQSGERADRGAGLRLLLAPTSSPLLGSLIDKVVERNPEMKLTIHSPLLTGQAEEASRALFGRSLISQADLSQASTILSIDEDFLGPNPTALRCAHQFAAGRRPASPSRLYVVEPLLSVTGTMADHRIVRRSSRMFALACAVGAEVLAHRGGADSLRKKLTERGHGESRPLVEALARDLLRSGTGALIVVGERQPKEVHAVAALLNQHLQKSKRTSWFTEPALYRHDARSQPLSKLVEEIDQGAVDTLVILDGNPVLTAPGNLELGRGLSKVAHCLYVGMYENETAAFAHSFVPLAHELESWGDARAYDGTRSLVQPLIEPLHGGRTLTEVVAVLAGDRLPDAHRLLKDHYLSFGKRFDEALQKGLFQGSASAPVKAEVDLGKVEALVTSAVEDPSVLEFDLRPHGTVYDGRFTNNPWLLELPDPITKLTWENAALLSVRTAARLKLERGAIVELKTAGRRLRAPVMIIPGQADDVVGLSFGFGRTGAEALARDRGYNAYLLRTTTQPWFGPVELKKTGDRELLGVTQEHTVMMGRPIALSTTFADYRKEPGVTELQKGRLPSLMAPVPQDGEQWAMSIDLSLCTGCSACMVACQAENNVLVVGKQNVIEGREMHWLRVDTYYSGDPETPEVMHQPMMCQHCETAPCEYVCPVNATVHSPDGLNEMIYNRCVGTRFCSNNCPYKVRRFNWFKWQSREPVNSGLVELQRNPEVTVRERGVMEKCTYCVQRIRTTEIKAEVEGRKLRPGEVRTACQQTCPTGAIAFGSLRHRDTEMVRRREEPRSYQVLHEQGTRPRTFYLARLRNPNPELGGSETAALGTAGAAGWAQGEDK
jgi:MoCo/4Fe-4S cofactor protein with predicted Tat translocation signal